MELIRLDRLCGGECVLVYNTNRYLCIGVIHSGKGLVSYREISTYHENAIKPQDDSRILGSDYIYLLTADEYNMLVLVESV